MLTTRSLQAASFYLVLGKLMFSTTADYKWPPSSLVYLVLGKLVLSNTADYKWPLSSLVYLVLGKLVHSTNHC